MGDEQQSGLTNSYDGQRGVPANRITLTAVMVASMLVVVIVATATITLQFGSLEKQVQYNTTAVSELTVALREQVDGRLRGLEERITRLESSVSGHTGNHPDTRLQEQITEMRAEIRELSRALGHVGRE